MYIKDYGINCILKNKYKLKSFIVCAPKDEIGCGPPHSDNIIQYYIRSDVNI